MRVISRLDLDVDGLTDAPPCGWWISTRACGRMKRLPGAPGASTPPRPRPDRCRSCTSGLMYHRVVDTNRPVISPPGS
jgi:hypothetical protein